MQNGSDRPKRSALASPVQWVIWSFRLQVRPNKVTKLCRLHVQIAEWPRMFLWRQQVVHRVVRERDFEVCISKLF